MRYIAGAALAIMIMPVSAQPPPRLVLTTLQKQALVEAYRMGGLIFAAIILQESSGCAILHGKLDPHAFGCGQLHHDTADGIAGTHVSTWMLMHDWDLNMSIALEHLRNCTAEFGKFGGITCYQQGEPESQNLSTWFLLHSPYLHTIERRMRQLQALPISTD